MVEKTRVRSLAIAIALIVALFFALQVGASFIGVPDDEAPLRAGILALCIGLIVSQLVKFADRPRGYATLAAAIPTAIGAGMFAGAALLQFLLSLFVHDPAFDRIAAWASVAAFGLVLLRAQKRLLDEAMRPRRADGTHTPPGEGDLPKGRLPTQAFVALGVLTVAYALLGLGAYNVFRGLSGLIPEAGLALTVGIAIYVLMGARLFLAFAALEARAEDGGFWPWFKANLVQNTIVVLLLGAYAVYRDAMAQAVPMFALWEFALAVALFGFVLMRLRNRLKQQLADAPVVSDKTPHAQRVQLVSEPDYDALASSVRAFVERGRASRQYAENVRTAARVASDAEAARLLRPVATWNDPPVLPPLPITWALSAGLASALGFALFVYVYVADVIRPDVPGLPPQVPLAVGALGLGIYRLDGLVRSYAHVWPSLIASGVGVALALAAFASAYYFTDQPGSAPPQAWYFAGGIAAFLLVVALLRALAFRKRMRADPLLFHPDEGAEARDAKARDKERKVLRTVAFITAIGVLVLPGVLEWASDHGPDEQTAFLAPSIAQTYDQLLPPILFLLAGLATAAALRLWGLTRERPRAIARERALRAKRLELHKTVMRQIERV